jgi:hypothetical protein
LQSADASRYIAPTLTISIFWERCRCLHFPMIRRSFIWFHQHVSRRVGPFCSLINFFSFFASIFAARGLPHLRQRSGGRRRRMRLRNHRRVSRLWSVLWPHHLQINGRSRMRIRPVLRRLQSTYFFFIRFLKIKWIHFFGGVKFTVET